MHCKMSCKTKNSPHMKFYWRFTHTGNSQSHAETACPGAGIEILVSNNYIIPEGLQFSGLVDELPKMDPGHLPRTCISHVTFRQQGLDHQHFQGCLYFVLLHSSVASEVKAMKGLCSPRVLNYKPNTYSFLKNYKVLLLWK